MRSNSSNNVYLAAHTQRSKVYVFRRYKVCVYTKPQGRIRLVRGKIKRTRQGLPWCNTGLSFWSLEPSPGPPGWNDPLNLFCNFLDLPFSFSVVFSHLSLSLSLFKRSSPQPSHPSLSHTGTSERAAAKWPALCFILLLVRFCFCLWRFDFRSQSPGGLL